MNYNSVKYFKFKCQYKHKLTNFVSYFNIFIPLLSNPKISDYYIFLMLIYIVIQEKILLKKFKRMIFIIKPFFSNLLVITVQLFTKFYGQKVKLCFVSILLLNKISIYIFFEIKIKIYITNFCCSFQIEKKTHMNYNPFYQAHHINCNQMFPNSYFNGQNQRIKTYLPQSQVLYSEIPYFVNEESRFSHLSYVSDKNQMIFQIIPSIKEQNCFKKPSKLGQISNSYQSQHWNFIQKTTNLEKIKNKSVLGIKYEQISSSQSINEQQELQLKSKYKSKHYDKGNQRRNQFFIREKQSKNQKKEFYQKYKHNRQIGSYQTQIIKELTKQMIVYLLYNQNDKDQEIKTIKSSTIEEIRRLINKDAKKTERFLDELIKILTSRFSKFKKTKQQMIKYMFRKIYNSKNKPAGISQLKWRISQKIHKKNQQNFKSMNIKYVKKQFQNPIFGQLFEIFSKEFPKKFQEQNDARIDQLNQLVFQSLIKNDLKEIKQFKKLPWNLNTKNFVISLCKSLLEVKRQMVYEENLVNKLIQNFRNGYAEEYRTLMANQQLIQK